MSIGSRQFGEFAARMASDARIELEGLRCNPVQDATASPAFTATLTMWSLHLTESKGDAGVLARSRPLDLLEGRRGRFMTRI